MADLSTPSAHMDLAQLAVLGILYEGERHPYEIARHVHSRHQEDPPGHTNRSLYHAVDKLATSGLIEAAETLRDGKRPERTVYRITEEGREEFRHTLTDMLVNPHLGPHGFGAAISRLGYLSEHEAVMALGIRLASLEGMIAHAQASARILRERAQLPRLFLLQSEYALTQMQAEAQWVGSVIESIRHGELDVDSEWLNRIPAQIAGAGRGTPLALLQHKREEIERIAVAEDLPPAGNTPGHPGGIGPVQSGPERER